MSTITTELKDWRGKIIAPGVKILWSGVSGTGIGVVHMTLTHSKHYHQVFVNWLEHNSHSNKRSQPLDPANITVLDGIHEQPSA